MQACDVAKQCALLEAILVSEKNRKELVYSGSHVWEASDTPWCPLVCTTLMVKYYVLNGSRAS